MSSHLFFFEPNKLYCVYTGLDFNLAKALDLLLELKSDNGFLSAIGRFSFIFYFYICTYLHLLIFKPDKLHCKHADVTSI